MPEAKVDHARRYARQARLGEIGEAGQARLSASTLDVPRAGLSSEIEARYLARAGVRVTRSTEGAASPELGPAIDRDFADPASRDVAEGALRAVARICDLLERA